VIITNRVKPCNVARNRILYHCIVIRTTDRWKNRFMPREYQGAFYQSAFYQSTLRSALLLAAVTLVLTTVLFPAFTVYFGNVYDFSVAYRDLIAPAAVLAAVLSGLLFVVALALPRRFRPLLLSILVMMALAAWVQANLLVQDYGVLDGGTISWRDYTLHGVFGLFVWLAALVVAWRFSNAVAGNAMTLCMALLAVQTAGLAFTVQQAPQPPSHHYFTVADDHKFRYSTQNNVIVLVLDAFQADIFGEIINNEPEYRRAFQGFTWFHDALAGYAKTYPSIPLMLSGQWYENTEPMNAFMRRAYMDNSLPQFLRAEGWDVGLHPLFERTFHFDERLASNFVRDRSEADRMAAFGELLDVGVFRTLPHFLKPLWLNDYQWRARRWMMQLPIGDEQGQSGATGFVGRSEHPHGSMRWLEDMEAFSSADAGAPVFRFYHLFVPHAPFALDESLEMANLRIDRQGFYRHSVAALNLTLRFLERLRALDVYDNSFIAVVSEHGGGEYRVGVDATVLNEYRQDQESEALPANVPSSHHESGLALLLLKPPGASGELEISNRPASVADLADTLTAHIDDRQAFGGLDLFSENWPFSVNTERERRYLFYRFDGWTDDYLPAMTEYRVAGHSWLPQSWQATGERLEGARGEHTEASAGSPLAQGHLLRFSLGSPGREVLRSGWGGQEPEGFWTTASRAIMILPLDDTVSNDLTISVHLTPMRIDDIVDEQRVRVNANGEHVTDWLVSHQGWYDLAVSEAIHRSAGFLVLELELPDATSQVEHLVGTDDRRLGVFLRQLRLDALPVYSLGDDLLFREGGGASDFVRAGWAEAEITHRWTDGESAHLEIVLDESAEAGRDMQLRFLVLPYLGDGALAQQHVTVQVNDTVIAGWQVDDRGWYEALIPSDIIAGETMMRLQLDISDPLAPADVGVSPDTRNLGLQVERMVIDYVN